MTGHTVAWRLEEPELTRPVLEGDRVGHCDRIIAECRSLLRKRPVVSPSNLENSETGNGTGRMASEDPSNRAIAI